MNTADTPKPPSELDAIVDRVLAYNPKDGKATAKRKRRSGSVAEEPPVYFSRRKQSPGDD